MFQKSYQPTNHPVTLSDTLQTLSAREQIDLILRTTRSLSNRDKAEVLGTGGLSFLKDHFLSILFHFFIKRIVAGTFLWLLCIIAAFLVLILLSFVEQLNPQAVTPVAVAGGSFFLGFLLFSFFSFLSDIAQFFKTTRSHNEFNALLALLNAQEYPEKVALLRSLSAALSRKVPGTSLFTSLLSNALLLLIVALLIALLILLSHILPMLGNFPWLLLIAGFTFLLGFYSPHKVQKLLLASHSINRKAPVPK